jgi:hypothetical protein
MSPGPDFDAARVVEHIHGHLGWLTAVALVHPAIVLRNLKRRAHLAVGLATGMATLAGGLGAWVYGPYRDRLKQGIFIHARWIGLLFERKEHLAVGAIGLAWAGAVAYIAAMGAEEGTRVALRTFAWRAFIAAAALAFVVGGLGVVVATYKTF